MNNFLTGIVLGLIIALGFYIYDARDGCIGGLTGPNVYCEVSQ